MNIYRDGVDLMILLGGIFGSIFGFMIAMSTINDDNIRAWLVIPTMSGVCATFLIWNKWTVKAERYWIKYFQELKDNQDAELMKKEREIRNDKQN